MHSGSIRSRWLARGAALTAAAVATVALAGVASAGGAADTTVTIRGDGEIFGYVKSPKPRRCAKDRLVKVFKQRGEQGGGDDIKVGSDRASLNGDRYQWSIGNPGVAGRVYARAPRIEGCRADNSPTITVGN